MQQFGQSGYSYDIFLSYASRDLDYAQDFELLLSQIGLKTFFDRQHQKMGDIREHIRDAIRRSRYFAIILTENTTQSQWLEYESNQFLETSGNRNPTPLIVLQFARAELPVSVSHFNSRITYRIDCTESFIDGFTELTRLLYRGRNGLLSYFPFQHRVPPALWHLFYRRVSRQIDLIGHAMGPTFDDDRDKRYVLPALKDRNVAMRIILLTPNRPRLQQLREVQRGLQPATNLPEKISSTVKRIQTLRQDLYPDKLGNISVRTTDKIMYASVSTFDSIALITNYTSREEVGANSPTLFVAHHDHNGSQEDLYSFYKSEFQRYWNEATHPEEERHISKLNASTRILEHRHHVSKIEAWRRNEAAPLPAPTQC